MCFWTLLSLQLIAGACRGVSALTIPEEDLRGKWLAGPRSIRYASGRKPGEGPRGAAQFPLGTDLVPSASLSVGKEGHDLGSRRQNCSRRAKGLSGEAGLRSAAG